MGPNELRKLTLWRAEIRIFWRSEDAGSTAAVIKAVVPLPPPSNYFFFSAPYIISDNPYVVMATGKGIPPARVFRTYRVPGGRRGAEVVMKTRVFAFPKKEEGEYS